MTIFGWDMSHYDAPSIGTALGEGISFITHKVGGDSNSGDSELAPWWSNVRGTDPMTTLLGGYWVPRPDLYPNAAGEAVRWIATLDARCPGWRDREHILQLDAEIWNQDSRTKPSKAYLAQLAGKMVALAPRLRPILYASKGQYGDSLAGLVLPDGMPIPLWNANYPSNAQVKFKALYDRVGGDIGAGWTRYSGQMPVIWQYGSSATIGGQTTCDANAFRGTLDQLKAIVAPGWVAPIEGDDVTQDDIIAALTKFFAAAPGTNPDGLKENAIGKGAWNQPVPNPLRTLAGQATTTRTYAYQLLADIAQVIAGLPTADQNAQALIAALHIGDLNAAAAALRAAFGNEDAAALGALLVQ